MFALRFVGVLPMIYYCKGWKISLLFHNRRTFMNYTVNTEQNAVHKQVSPSLLLSLSHMNLLTRNRKFESLVFCEIAWNIGLIL